MCGRPGQDRTIEGLLLAGAWRVTSAVTPALPEEAETALRIIVCQNTPDQGYNDTQSRRRDSCGA